MRMVLFLMIGCLFSCVTTKDAGHLYFRKGHNVKGVESVDSLLERMKKDRTLREIMYGQALSAKIIQCTLLRNQLYVASLSRSPSAEIEHATSLIEPAYQENDQAFLQACHQVLSTDVGRNFAVIQQEYLSGINQK